MVGTGWRRCQGQEVRNGQERCRAAFLDRSSQLYWSAVSILSYTYTVYLLVLSPNCLASRMQKCSSSSPRCCGTSTWSYPPRALTGLTISRTIYGIGLRWRWRCLLLLIQESRCFISIGRCHFYLLGEYPWHYLFFSFRYFIMALRVTWWCYESRKARGEKEEKEKDKLL